MTLVDVHQVCLAGGVPLPLLWPSLLLGLSCWMNSLEPRKQTPQDQLRPMLNAALQWLSSCANLWISSLSRSVDLWANPHGGTLPPRTNDWGLALRFVSLRDHRFSNFCMVVHTDFLLPSFLCFKMDSVTGRNCLGITFIQPLWVSRCGNQRGTWMSFLIQPFVQNEWVEVDRYRWHHHTG